LCTEKEEIIIGLEVGGEISRESAESYGQASSFQEKSKFLKKKAVGLIIQNPHSGFGLEKDLKRRKRFFGISADNFWREPKNIGN